MTIYATNVSDVQPPQKIKKTRAKKVKEDVAPVAPQNVEPVAAPVKEKKPRTQAQIEATKKAAEARRVKKMEMDRVMSQVKENEEALAKLVAMKEAKMVSKKRAKKILTPPPSEISEAVDEAVGDLEKQPPKKRQKMVVKIDAPPSEEPPAYLKKYIEGMLKSQNAISDVKKPVKQIKDEANEQSRMTWADNVKRDGFKTEVDNHMNRMYSMMFAR